MTQCQFISTAKKVIDFSDIGQVDFGAEQVRIPTSHNYIEFALKGEESAKLKEKFRVDMTTIYRATISKTSTAGGVKFRGKRNQSDSR